MGKAVCGCVRLELGEEEGGEGGASEGGVHSPLQLYDFERFVPFQFAADPVEASDGERSVSHWILLQFSDSVP